MKANRVISFATALLTLFLACSSFVLSYSVLQDLALNNGVKSGLSFLWPLCLDAFMIASGLSVLRASLNKESTLYPWLLVGLFSIASVGYNVLHAPHTLIAQSVAALPPLTVFLALELLSKQVKTKVLELQKVERKVQKVSKTVVIDASEHARQAKRVQDELDKQQAFDIMLNLWKSNPNTQPKEIVQAIGKSRTSFYSYKKELEKTGRIRSNGEGVIVQ